MDRWRGAFLFDVES